MILNRFATFALTSALALTTGSTTLAQGYEHIDQLALQLERQTRALRSEFAEHFRHANHYTHLRNDAARMNRLARHIHQLAHYHAPLAHIDHDLDRLDRSFHHIEELLGHIAEDTYHGVGHLDGAAAHVQVLMAEMNDTLHHLHSDIEQLRRPTCPVDGGHGGHEYSGHRVGYRTGGIRVGGGSISVGNGQFRFRFGR